MIADKKRVGIIGATSFIGEYLIPLLAETDVDIIAFSRTQLYENRLPKNEKITWCFLQVDNKFVAGDIAQWICLAPIGVLPQYLSLLSHYGIKRIVALSSTNRFAKIFSSDDAERKLAETLIHSEETLVKWAEQNNMQWTILRPTLIYGLGRDKNINVMANFIRRFSFFPLLGEAQGLRQPVHARDVALACIAALDTKKTFNRSYNISGGETMTYRQMVEKVFESLGKKPRFVVLPLWLFRTAISAIRLLPRFRHWSAAMAERMNQNLIFDHHEATNDFGFAPQKFILDSEDISAKSPI